MFKESSEDNSDWIVHTGIHFNRTSNIVLTPEFNTIKPVGQERDEKKENNNVLIIGLAIPFVVVILAAVLGIYLKKKKPTAKEEPEMEKNENYGIDDEYYDEHNNRVQDKNDYYQ